MWEHVALVVHTDKILATMGSERDSQKHWLQTKVLIVNAILSIKEKIPPFLCPSPSSSPGEEFSTTWVTFPGMTEPCLPLSQHMKVPKTVRAYSLELHPQGEEGKKN